MKYKIIALALAFGTAACATASNDRPQGLVATEADIPAAHAALKKAVKDPNSVQYEADIFRPGVVCGTFNAKNSYGGYVGQTLYLYVIATGEVQILDRSGTPNENSAATARFERYCPS